MLGEVPTNQKLDDTNYDIWHRKIQYLLNEKDLLEHLIITKSSPSEQDKDGKPIDVAFVQYQEVFWIFKIGPIGIVERALQCYIAWMAILLVGLRVVPLLRTCGTNLISVSTRHPLQDSVSCT